jgi:retrotransposon gag protein/zinc knuckle protein
MANPAPQTAPTKEVRMNPPKPFTGKRTELKRFMQDVIVYTTINKEIYDTDDKKIAFTISFMNDGDAGAWKEEFLARKIAAANTAGDDVTFGTWGAFRTALDDSFSPFDAPGDALSEMRNLKMGQDASIDEHVAKFKILVSQSGLGDSAALADFFRETLPTGLQRQILTSDPPPVTLAEWYDKAARYHNNWRRMQRILGRGDKTRTWIPQNRTQNTSYTNGTRKFIFPKKERDPNAMDVDRLSIEERTALMKEGRCFKCKQQGHMSRDCNQGNQPQQKQETKKKWDGKGAAAHLRALVATMDDDEKKKFEEDLETEGLGF